ncbi:hypothetical protein [Bradyrhizobium sp. sBnM-33]|uniref:hypothetical protein n=1 Tax=Bradyrhizobium sp. sBnM-33 TaxID=2831780 RepID=UPI001BCE5B58|nr:hypothetical protein [Bradyrhizobium sp. sBnM-33]WOH48870.1 hypothetical protein RX328_32985 [Bradyrhizobium sp. sBnM-33]
MTGYLLAYLAFRSLMLAFLFGFGLATTTFNYHVYAVSGSVIILPVVTFMLIFAYAQSSYCGGKLFTLAGRLLPLVHA